MSRGRPFFGITLLCFCLHLGATAPSDVEEEEPQCRCFIHDSEKAIHLRALEKYEKAFRNSFDAQWPEAEKNSDCAGLLDHGTTHWAVDAKKFSKH